MEAACSQVTGSSPGLPVRNVAEMAYATASYCTQWEPDVHPACSNGWVSPGSSPGVPNSL